MQQDTFPMNKALGVHNVRDLVDTLATMQSESTANLKKGNVSLAMDMADDMSMLLSSFLQSHRVAKKKSSSLESIVEECETFIEESDPDCLIKINDFARGGAMAAKQLLNFMHKLFPDPTQIAILLQGFILQKKKGNKDEDDVPEIPLAVLETASEILKQGPEKKKIKVGLNSVSTTRKFSMQVKSDVIKLRRSYEHFITFFREPIELYQELIKEFGVANRYILLEYHNQVLHCDINSLDPSCNTQEFGLLLEANFRMNLLCSADQLFMQSLLGKNYKPSNSEYEIKLLNFFLKMISDSESVRITLMELINSCKAYHSGTDKTNFVQQIYNAIQRIPITLFTDDFSVAEQIKEDIETTVATVIEGFALFTTGGRIYG